MLNTSKDLIRNIKKNVFLIYNNQRLFLKFRLTVILNFCVQSYKEYLFKKYI